jgi:DNA-binding transcriptional LysR family regulator
LKGKDIVVALNASVNSHDGGFLIDAAEQGFGIARLPDFMVSKSLEAGRLIEVMPAYTHKVSGVFVVYPAARYLPHRTRTLVDFLIAGITRK